MSNFLSISDEVEISFIKGDGDEHPEQYVSGDEYDVLKTAILFGKNGAGKSNIIMSLAYVTRILVDYPTIIMNKTDLSRIEGDIHNKNNASPISTFRFNFSTNYPLQIISYSLRYNSIEQSIYEETISFSAIDGMVYTRDSEGSVTVSESTNESSDYQKKYDYSVPCNQSLIGYFGDMSADKASDDLISLLIIASQMLYLVFNNNVVMSFESEDVVIDRHFFVREDIVDYLEHSLSKVSDVDGVIIEDLKKNGVIQSSDSLVMLTPEPILVMNGHVYRLLFRESGNDKFVEFSRLSTGIRRIVTLLIITSIGKPSLRGGKKLASDCRLIAIDEMCYSLHPKITRQLIEIIFRDPFNDRVDTQFIYTMHDTNVLSMCGYRSDEFYLVDKKDGITAVNSIYDFEQSSGDLQKMYLDGRFGSIPKIGNYRRII